MPATLIPNPDLSEIPVARERTFVFGTDGDPAEQRSGHVVRTARGASAPTAARMLDADYGRVSAAPRFGTREIWTLVNDGGGWDHPIHIHFEEGQILARNGSARKVPAWERGRKDVYRLRPGGSVTITHAVPRLGRHVHGALPQHDARGQRDAAALGDQHRRRAVPARRCRRRSRRRRASRSSDPTHDWRRGGAMTAGRVGGRWPSACVAAGHRRSLRGTTAAGRAELALGSELLSQRGADDAGRKDGPLLRRLDQGQDRRDQPDLHDVQVRLPARDRAPGTGQKLLGDRMGRDVFFYSITIDPEHDTPAVLKAYAEKFHAGPGWLFLTGKKADIDLISRKLGLYSEPDPSTDGHTPHLLIGNEATGQWIRNSALDNPRFLATRSTAG